MSTITTTRRDADGNLITFVDNNTQETLVRLQPIQIDEDFLGAGHASIPVFGSPAAGYPWVQKVVKTGGSPSVAIVANGAGGIVALALDSTSEKQETTLYVNDQLNWDMTKSAVFEARVAFSTLPGASVEMVFGLQSAWINGPDNASYYARFQALASGAVNCQTKDGITTTSKASGVTLTAGAFHIFRIDATTPSNIVFTIDGVQVNANNALSFLATGASAVLQVYCSVYKASGAGTGAMQVDMIQVAANRV